MKRLFKKLLILFSLIAVCFLAVSCHKNSYSVTFDLNGGNLAGQTDNKIISVEEGSKINKSDIPVPIKDGFVFEFWQDGNKKFDFETLITENKTLKAKWNETGGTTQNPKKEYFKLTLPVGVLSDQKDNEKIEKDTEVTLTLTLKANYEIVEFSVNGEDKINEIQNNTYKFTINKDTVVIYDTQEITNKNYYKLELPQGVTSNVVNNQKILEETEVELELTVLKNYEIVEFSVNGEDKINEIVNNKYKFTITKDTVVTFVTKQLYFSLDLPARVKSDQKDNTKLEKDTEVVLTIDIPQNHIINMFRINGDSKIDEIDKQNNTIKIIITKDTLVEIEFLDNTKQKELDILNKGSSNEVRELLDNKLKDYANYTDLSNDRKPALIQDVISNREYKSLQDAYGLIKKLSNLRMVMQYVLDEVNDGSISLERAEELSNLFVEKSKELPEGTKVNKEEIDYEQLDSDHALVTGQNKYIHEAILKDIKQIANKDSFNSFVSLYKKVLELTNKYAETLFTVTFTDNLIASKKVKYGELLEEPKDSPQKQYYDFTGYKLDGKDYDFNTPVLKDLEIELVFEISQDVKDDVSGVIEQIEDSYEFDDVSLDDIQKITELLTEQLFYDKDEINVSVKKDDPNFIVTVTHKETKYFLTKEIEIKQVKTFKVDLGTNLELVSPNGLNLEKVKAGEEITLKVINKQYYITDKVIINKISGNEQRENTDKLKEFDFRLTVTDNISFTVNFIPDPAIYDEVNSELLKIEDLVTVETDGTENIESNQVLQELKKYVDLDLVTPEIIQLNGNKADILLRSNKVSEVSATKEITISILKVKVTINLNGGETVNGDTVIVLDVIKNGQLQDYEIEATNKDRPGAGITSFTKDSTTGEAFDFITPVVADLVLYVVWGEVIELKLNYGDNTKIVKVSKNNQKTVADLIPDNLEPVPGKFIANWMHDGNLYDTNLVLKESIELEALLEDYLEYREEDGEITIVGLTQSGQHVTEIVIPNEINGKTVTKIDYRAFASSNVVKFIANNDLKIIDSFAFYNCNELTTVKLNENLETVGLKAFKGSGLKEINIPSNLKNIGYAAFNSNALETVELPSDYTNLDIQMFSPLAPWLTKLDYNNTGLCIVNGVLIYNQDVNTDEVELPKHVKIIGKRAFYDNELITITFNEGLEIIKQEAFSGCNQLEELNFPESLREIDFRAFYNTNSVDYIKFEGNGLNIENIENNAFEVCGVNTIYWPEGLKVVNEFVFNYCGNLKTIKGDLSNIEEIKGDAFKDTLWLAEKRATEGLVIVNDILIDAYEAKNDTVIPQNVKVIAERAYDRPEVTKIVIPETVKTIKTNAFYEMRTSLTFELNGFVENVEKYAINFFREDIEYTLIITDINERPDTWDEEFYLSYTDFLKIIWAPEVTIKFDLNGGEVKNKLDPIVLENGQTITIPSETPTKDNSTFTGWYLDGKLFNFDTKIERSITLVANYLDDFEDFDFTVYNEKATITKWKKDANEITVPDKVGPFEVVKIGDNAFNGLTVNKVILPKSINQLGNEVFKGVTNLEEIVIPESVEEIGYYAFSETKWLENKQNENPLVVVNDILIDGEKLTGEVTINSNVRLIAAKAVENNQNITKVIINEGVAKVNKEAFRGCVNLTKVTLPNSLRNVEEFAFSIEGSNTLNIDASKVYHTRPNGYHVNWAKENQTNKIVVTWEDAPTVTITVPDSIKPTDNELVLDQVILNEEVEFVVSIPEFKQIKTLLVNGDEYKDDVNNENKFIVKATKDIVITCEFEFLPELVKDVEDAINKFGVEYGISQTGKGLRVDLINSLESIIDKDRIKIIVTPTNEVDLFKVKVVSQKTDLLFKESEIKVIALLDMNGEINLDSIQYSRFVNYQESPRFMFDSDRYTTKWCDNSGTSEKYVSFKLKTPREIGAITIHHAGVNEDKSLNTKQFKVSYSDDGYNWLTLFEVTNNKDTITNHSFPLTKVNYMRFSSTQGEQGGNVTRIYDFRIFGKGEESVTLNFDFNGGRLSTEEDDDNINMILGKGMKLETAIRPTPIKKYYEIAGWTIDGKEVDLDNHVFNDETKLVAIWKPSPQLTNTLTKELDKVRENSVIKDVSADFIVNEDSVKEYILTIINSNEINVVVEHIKDNQYKININHKDIPDVTVNKVVNIYTAQVGEKVKLTFDLAGGKFGGEEIVTIEFDKGYELKEEDIIKPIRKFYDLASWTIDNQNIELVDMILYDDITVTASWGVTQETEEDLINQLIKLPDEIIAVECAGTEPTKEEIIETVLNIVNRDLYDVDVEYQGHMEEYYIIISHKYVTDLKTKTGRTYPVGKLAKMITKDNVSVMGTNGPNFAVVGRELNFEVILIRGLVVEKVLINGKDEVPFDSYDNSFSYKAEGDFTVEIKTQVNKDEAFALLQEIKETIPEELFIPDPENYDLNKIKELLENNFIKGKVKLVLKPISGTTTNYTYDLVFKEDEEVKITDIPLEIVKAKAVT